MFVTQSPQTIPVSPPLEDRLALLLEVKGIFSMNCDPLLFWMEHCCVPGIGKLWDADQRICGEARSDMSFACSCSQTWEW
jgi:hypothetical protein